MNPYREIQSYLPIPFDNHRIITIFGSVSWISVQALSSATFRSATLHDLCLQAAVSSTTSHTHACSFLSPSDVHRTGKVCFFQQRFAPEVASLAANSEQLLHNGSSTVFGMREQYLSGVGYIIFQTPSINKVLSG